ncbi:OmpP1/FadL family transporter [Polaribacter sargassicola]|uniref:OmpP1/FadL family transporter n=1 Tax=Polaribacter sargassicola TaxID=2836891 RepID=UPI001F229861|nr:hemin receptor [Polaribacter sp. DS7-9]MCG1037269.1 hemin receptor [Polaribacter sp. DS7-9]
MKKILTFVIFTLITLTSYSQSLGYQDLGILFSKDDENGTARFKAMSGAFGALGGDISAINVNPAGIAVFKNSIFSGSVNSRNSDITSNYYGNSIKTNDNFINISSAGAVLVFDSAYKSQWSKFAIGFNYRITKDFTDSFLVQGNSGVATFIDFPLDSNTTPIIYDTADQQFFTNNYTGETTEFNIAFSSVHQNKLYVGASLNFYDLNFSQKNELVEFNSDGNGNELDAYLYQENITTGTGFSANLGFIYKANQNFRFGLSYQTPTWYSEIIESTNILNNDGYFGDTEISVSEDNITYSNNVDNNGNYYYPYQEFLYKLKTPSKITASTAYIFGKSGLISIDYINKAYENTKLSNSNFNTENQFFQNELRSTHSFNVGTEWRLNNFSVRGGYKFEQNPDKLALDSDNLEGYSIGGGYNFGHIKLDFAFNNSNRTAAYNFYSGFNVNSAELEIDNRTFTTTISINL